MDIDLSFTTWVSTVSGLSGLALGFVVRPAVAAQKWRVRARRHKANLVGVEMVAPTFEQWERKPANRGYEWVGLPITIRNHSQDMITNVSFGMWQRGRESDPSEAGRYQIVERGGSIEGVAWTSLPSSEVAARFSDRFIFFVRFNDADAKRWRGVFDIKAKTQWTVRRFE